MLFMSLFSYPFESANERAGIRKFILVVFEVMHIQPFEKIFKVCIK